VIIGTRDESLAPDYPQGTMPGMSTISGTSIPTGQALAISGSAAIIVGSLLPWVTARRIFGQLSVNGVEGDGKLTLVLGVSLLLGVILRFGTTRWRNVLIGVQP
jgi:hypothetical protein